VIAIGEDKQNPQTIAQLVAEFVEWLSGACRAESIDSLNSRSEVTDVGHQTRDQIGGRPFPTVCGSLKAGESLTHVNGSDFGLRNLHNGQSYRDATGGRPGGR
jgi:hypothetical protein